MARDEYGNPINRPNRSTKGSRRGSTGALIALEGGRVGYTPIFTGRSGNTGNQKTQMYPPRPNTFTGTEPEWAILWAHSVLGLREGQDFGYLSHIGVAGLIDAFDAAQIDFFEYDLLVGIEIQGIYWHYEFGGHNKVVQDQERKARFESLGYTLIFIDEDDAIRDPIYYLRQARAGVDRSRVSRGF